MQTTQTNIDAAVKFAYDLMKCTGSVASTYTEGSITASVTRSGNVTVTIDGKIVEKSSFPPPLHSFHLRLILAERYGDVHWLRTVIRNCQNFGGTSKCYDVLLPL